MDQPSDKKGTSKEEISSGKDTGKKNQTSSWESDKPDNGQGKRDRICILEITATRPGRLIIIIERKFE